MLLHTILKEVMLTPKLYQQATFSAEPPKQSVYALRNTTLIFSALGCDVTFPTSMIPTTALPPQVLPAVRLASPILTFKFRTV